MPVSKSLKKLQKRKSDTALHARSLKYKQFTSAELRQSKLEKMKAARNEKHEVKLERFKMVKDVCDRMKQTSYTVEEMRTIIQSFIDRNRPELEKLESERRRNRPPSNKLLNIRNQIEAEEKEFQSGFNFVDLTDPKTVENLARWEGTLGGLNTLRMTRVSK